MSRLVNFDVAVYISFPLFLSVQVIFPKTSQMVAFYPGRQGGRQEWKSILSGYCRAKIWTDTCWWCVSPWFGCYSPLHMASHFFFLLLAAMFSLSQNNLFVPFCTHTHTHAGLAHWPTGFILSHLHVAICSEPQTLLSALDGESEAD